VLDQFSRLREPSVAIPIEITKLTGITQEMVAGQVITPEEVEHFGSSAAVVIAHNAVFDRRFVERAYPVFSTKNWACSLSQVDWVQEGFDGSKLAYLLAGCGLFHEGHRADEDCRALLEILSRPLPMTGDLAFKRLLDTARKPTMRVWAENAPFDFKATLEPAGPPPSTALVAEVTFLPWRADGLLHRSLINGYAKTRPRRTCAGRCRNDRSKRFAAA
jgi:DNA polymerase-3 subunit epsilon